MNNLILILLLITQLRSEDCINCTQKLPEINLQVGEIEKLAQQTIDCPENLFLQDAKEKYEKALKNPAKIISKTINGQKISGREDEINLLVSAMDKNPPDWFAMKAKTCSTPHCMLSALYKSNEVAMRSFAIYKETGYVLSAHQSVKDQYAWSPQETRILHETFNYLPAKFDRLSHLDELTILPEGYSLHGDPNTLAWASPSANLGIIGLKIKGEVTFTHKSLKSRGPHSAIHTIIHEMAHHIDYSSLDRQADGDRLAKKSGYMKLNGWVKDVPKKDKKGKAYMDWRSTAKDSCFVSSYAATEPAEDFAEAVAEFFIDPQHFKRKCPKHYAFIKNNIFDGKEYSPPGPVINTNNLAKKCAKVTQELIVFNQRSTLTAREIENDYFKVDSIPSLKIDEACYKQGVDQAISKLGDQEKINLCLFNGPKELIKSKMNEGKKELEDISAEISYALKRFDWSKAVEACPKPLRFDSNCLQEQVVKTVKKQTDLGEKAILEGLKITPKLKPSIINDFYQSRHIIDCMKTLAKARIRVVNEPERMPEIMASVGSVYCADNMKKIMKADKLLPEKENHDAFMFNAYYFKDADTQKRAKLLEAEFQTARSEIKCGMFGKSNCERNKLFDIYKESPDKFTTLPRDLNKDEFIDLAKIFEDYK